jgi:hypothetical protein
LLTVSEKSASEVAEFFRNKMVILGDVHAPSSEDFSPPGQPIAPRVFGHAVGAYTLAIDPVFEFKPLSRFLADTFASLPLFYLILRRAKAEAMHAAAAESQLATMAWICAFTVFLVGFARHKRLQT